MTTRSQTDDYLDTALADAWHATGELVRNRLDQQEVAAQTCPVCDGTGGDHQIGCQGEWR